MVMEWRDVRWKERCGVGECEGEWRALIPGEWRKGAQLIRRGVVVSVRCEGRGGWWEG